MSRKHSHSLSTLAYGTGLLSVLLACSSQEERKSGQGDDGSVTTNSAGTGGGVVGGLTGGTGGLSMVGIGGSGATGGVIGTSGGGPGSGGVDGTGGTPGEPPACVPASGISIKDVTFNQAVGAALVKDGIWVDPNAREVPLIHSREALLQITWELEASYTSHAVDARLTLVDGDAQETVMTSSRTPSGDADLGLLDSAFAFELDSEVIQADSDWKLELCETDGVAEGTEGQLTRFPQTGDLRAWKPWEEEMKLHVMIVPVSTNCSSSPPMGPAEQEVIRTSLLNLFPINDLDLRIHDPLHISDSCGEGDIMAILESLRDDEALGPEWYYQAEFSHEANTSSGGFAWVFEDDNQANADRVSWTHNWWDEQQVNVAHELGHNHGSDHTFSDWAEPPYLPAAGADYGGRETFGYAIDDGQYPLVNGDIDGRILRPTIDPWGDRLDHGEDDNFYDAMSYDQPYWVSAFTYNEWARRIRASLTWPQLHVTGNAQRLRAYRGEKGGLSFRLVSGAAKRSERQATITLGSKTVRTTGRVLRGCDDDFAGLDIALPAELELRGRQFSIEIDGRRIVHEPTRAKWFR